jgi:hypothetical protein
MDFNTLPTVVMSVGHNQVKITIEQNNCPDGEVFSWTSKSTNDKNIDSLSYEDIQKILGWANSFNRFDWFLKIKSKCFGNIYWQGLAYAYVDSDNLCEFRQEAKAAFNSNQPDKSALMTIEESEFLKNLPQRITIYRGMTLEEYESAEWSISWTLNKEIAEFFRDKYTRNLKEIGMPKLVHSITIDKSKVVAYFNGREEQEIIYIHNKM